jgi:hypothetical protein
MTVMALILPAGAFVLAQAGAVQEPTGAGLQVLTTIVEIIVLDLLLAFMFWKVFEKAGEPGWASLVPIYNLVVLVRVAGRPLWYVFGLLIPCVGALLFLQLCVDIARNFGKGVAFQAGLFFFAPIFFPILGFGSAQFQQRTGRKDVGAR